MIKYVLILLSSALPAQASISFACTELDRVSLSAEGSMRPVYEGRPLNFTWDEDDFSGDDIFYHDAYSINPSDDGGFLAFAENSDWSDLFSFENGTLMHTEIVKYGRAPSIQSQVFECADVTKF
ncbi:hypothetical protein N8388_08890 [Octadecabacter sp.]|nr:hypothetical protein [Octadecabacter sp.]MDC1501314.1 hypothetical protein [Octadecabacter sp.]